MDVRPSEELRVAYLQTYYHTDPSIMDPGAGATLLRISLRYNFALFCLLGDLRYQVYAKDSSSEIWKVGGVAVDDMDLGTTLRASVKKTGHPYLSLLHAHTLTHSF